MAVEIERKFLVQTEDWRTLSRRRQNLCQGYLARIDQTQTAEVRIRRVGNHAFITIKGKGGLVRSEFEYEIPADDAEAMLKQLCFPHLIEKTRHDVEYDEVLWHVDEYFGLHHGLVLAEVELQSEQQSIQIPSWIGQEVTGDPVYRNVNLAAKPECWRQK
jgi:CYTH domain-containing protein